jgi:AmiR/NasT family two-component response regulator
VADSGLSASSDDEALLGSVEQFLSRARERRAPLLLVVDRDPAWLGPLADQLARLNCRVVVAPQRAAADALIERLRPTLILWAAEPDVDLTLAWLERVLSVVPRPCLALLLDPSTAGRDLAGEAQALGAAGVLYRPPHAEAVLQAVRTWARLP